MTPAEVQVSPAERMQDRARGWWKRYKWFSLVVVLPTLLVGGYLFFFAADQYVSEAHYLVRSQGGQSQSLPTSGGSLLSGNGGGSALSAAAESLSVADYLNSHDAVDALQRRIDLVAMFRRPEADRLSRMPVERPTPEFLKRFYNRQVSVVFDEDNGITTLSARAFRPADAYALSAQLLRLGEQRINEMNRRAYSDAVALSRRQLDEAEASLRSIGSQVTSFRQSERDVDPQISASTQIGLVSRLQGELAAARAQLSTTNQLIGAGNPQTEALRQQIASLQQQVNAENARLAGNNGAIAAGLGDYEALRSRQEFLQQRYAAAATAFEGARQQAIRQQLYVVRVVEPNLPVKSTYPQRWLVTLTVFAILMVVYAIGWLIAAGVREHSV
ncbi:lipopolysaccharide biosynthesis protein [Sphingomonas sp.]|jgi:capsular polysaccharide transport system permease protein|uniref:lipopolysaccharide biosynthesis protein n=1 Tax=Sphingomonas sp. TaxID=28214 RepID=UPI0035C7AC0C